MKKKLYVILGDVISSRRISNRDVFRIKLEEACNKINIQHANDIFANFKILKGIDEIGGVLLNMSKCYEIINTIFEHLHPNSMRFALTFDYIDAAIETGDISKMSGPAFHKAADIIDTLKKSKLLFDMSVGNKEINRAISGQINLILLFKRNWSVKQYKVFVKYKELGNQLEVAKNFGITRQAVSKTLNRLMWKEIAHIERNLNFLLNDYTKNHKIS